MNTVARPQFDVASARGLTDEVKADAVALWAKLLDLYEGGAHLALGYSSWGVYYEAEFGGSKSAAYRILDAARVVPQLGNAPSPRSESVARELAPLRDEPEAMRAAWSESVERHGPEPTASQVREIGEPAPSAISLPSDGSEFAYKAFAAATDRDLEENIKILDANIANAITKRRDRSEKRDALAPFRSDETTTTVEALREMERTQAKSA